MGGGGGGGGFLGNMETSMDTLLLDMVVGRRPNMNPKLASHMDCSACRGTLLFYDRLRCVAIAKLDQIPHKACRDSRCAVVHLSV